MTTNYPTSLDDTTSLPRPTSTTAMNAAGFEGDVLIDNLSDAITAVETELGTDPSGGQSTVKERLGVLAQMALTGGRRSYVTGRYYGENNGNGLTTFALTANRLYFAPFFCIATTTFDRLVVYVSTAVAATNLRLGIFNSGSDGFPGTRLLDAGTVASATTGTKEITISQSLTADTVYWLGVVSDGAPSIRVRSNSESPSLGIGDNITTNPDTGIYMSHTYGALPASAGPLVYHGAGSSTTPALRLRAA